MVTTLLLQAGLIENLPLPTTTTLAFGIIMFLGGLAVPTSYGIERMQGLGRAIVSKLPYRAPPGMDSEEAMQQAVRREESVAGDAEKIDRDSSDRSESAAEVEEGRE